MKKILLSLSLAAIVLAGCNKEAGIRGGQGSMSINLTAEGEFTTPDETKADASDVVDVNTFAVTITNSDGISVNSWDSLKNVPGVIPMDPAIYKITATSQGMKDVAWNQPIYTGSQDINLEAGKVVNIDLTCKLRNMKVTVKCTQNFIEEMNPDFTIKVSTAKGYLEFTKAVIDQGTAKAGFFTVAPLTVDIKGTRKLDGSAVSHYFDVSAVAERDHHVFTVDARETGEISVGTSGITVDYTVNNKAVDIQVGDLEENPIEDDNTGAPEVKGASIAANSAQDISLGSIAVSYSLPIALAENANITLGDVPVTTSISGKVLTVSFGSLAYGTSYSLNIPAGAVVNATDNSEAAAYSLAFTTKEEPAEVPITITATGGIGTNAIYEEETVGATFVIDIAVEKGISSFPVEVQSQGLQDLIVEYNEGFETNIQPNVDLANMSEEEEGFWGSMFGKKSSDIKGSTSVHFSIGNFIFSMPKGVHPIKMTIIDNDGNRKEETITFEITPKPQD